MKNPIPSNNSNEATRLINYDELHFIPVEDKNELWAAETLHFIKGDSQPLVDPLIAKHRRMIERGWIDVDALKNIVDPEEKKAEFFSSDWKGNPIYNHLNNIVDAKIEKLPKNMVVKAADEISRTELMKENAKILGRSKFRKYLNGMLKQFGMPSIKDTEDPFKYVAKMAESQEAKPKAVATSTTKRRKTATKDIPVDLMESIKNSIEDDEDLALFNEYLHKDGVEIAIEIGIKYYMFDLNKYDDNNEDKLSDLRNFNTSVFRFSTSETTGLPVYDYMDPSIVNVSPFKKNDLSDIYHWYTEEYVTFGEFIRRFGATLNTEQLKKVFAKNKMHHNVADYEGCSKSTRSNAKIKIGYVEVLSQDMEVYTDYTKLGNQCFAKATTDYVPSAAGKKTLNAQRVERNYDVWYKFHYIPAITNDVKADGMPLAEQAKYIFGLGKVQDQMRYGNKLELVNTSLFGWHSKKMTWFEVMYAFMPQIDLLWQQYKNDLANAIPHGIMWVEEMLTMAMAVVDDEADNGADLKKKLMARIKQTGSGMANFLDKSGQIINQGKPFVDVKTGHLTSAMERLVAIMELYKMMTRALGVSEVSEGVDPKQRQSLGGIEMAMQGTNNSTFFIEKAFQKVMLAGAERMLLYFKKIVEYGTPERLQDFMDVVGTANGMAMQTIKGIPMRNLALSVHNIITDDQKRMLENMAAQMASTGMLSHDDALFITTIDNLKQAYAILRLKSKKKLREKQAEQAQQQANLMALKDKDLEIEITKLKLVQAGKMEERGLMGQIEERLLMLESKLKHESQMQIKDKIKDGRVEENVVNHQLDRANPQEKAA